MGEATMHVSVPSESVKKLENLSGKTIYIYLLMRAKLRYKKGLKILTPVTDIIPFTYKEAKIFNLGSKVFSKSINKLVLAGLVKIYKKGKYGGRTPTLYQLF